LGSIRKPEGTVNVALMVALGHTAIAPVAGVVDSTDTLAGGTAAAVLKLQT
jgi:hypothetical protein